MKSFGRKFLFISLLAALAVGAGIISPCRAVSADSGGYSVWDSGELRKVTDASGAVDAPWSICMNSDKWTPGGTGYATGGYTKTDYADESTYLNNRSSGSKGDFQKIKRLLYYRLTHPEVNYYVLQNEYWFLETGDTMYDTYWGDAGLDGAKADARAAINDSSLDAEIDEKMIVTIYTSGSSSYQNTISARLRAEPEIVVDTGLDGEQRTAMLLIAACTVAAAVCGVLLARRRKKMGKAVKK